MDSRLSLEDSSEELLGIALLEGQVGEVLTCNQKVGRFEKLTNAIFLLIKKLSVVSKCPAIHQKFWLLVFKCYTFEV